MGVYVCMCVCRGEGRDIRTGVGGGREAGGWAGGGAFATATHIIVRSTVRTYVFEIKESQHQGASGWEGEGEGERRQRNQEKPPFVQTFHSSWCVLYIRACLRGGFAAP